ncbi:MAG: hypothetical protein ACFBZ8_13155 [Opitutales bacterium]
MRWKRFGIYLTIALVLFFAGDRLGALALDAIASNSKNRFSRLYAGQAETEILMIGNSRGVNAIFSPSTQKRTGLRAFNLSYNGMGVQVVEAVLKDYLEHNPPPKLLLLEVTNLADNRSLLLNLKQFTGRSERLADLMRETYPKVYYESELSHLYRYNNEFFLRSLYHLRQDDQWWINRYSMSEEAARAFEPDPAAFASFVNIPEAHWAALESVVDLYRARGVDVRLLLSPYFPKYIATDANFEKFRADVKTWAAERNLEVLDYAAAVAGWKNFADPLHLNERGSELLLEQLIRDGVLPEAAQKSD